jgi:hypothetical protein
VLPVSKMGEPTDAGRASTLELSAVSATGVEALAGKVMRAVDAAASMMGPVALAPNAMMSEA